MFNVLTVQLLIVLTHKIKYSAVVVKRTMEILFTLNHSGGNISAYLAVYISV